ncbi:Rab family GTPase [Aspergillus lucknowensis]|uniref:P-loop containing nucleoside triphosphate hydrolase protein n=1 Tax=Aspergillus lucknowensis TaxID=176173 RepID=A0ABR4LPY6_9EURO
MIWDCAGAERYRHLVLAFTRDARVAVAVYDVSSRKSFEELLRTVEDHADGVRAVGLSLGATHYILVGNKVDLAGEGREVERADVEEVAQRMGYGFVETSAKSGEGVKRLFEMVGDLAVGKG